MKSRWALALYMLAGILWFPHDRLCAQVLKQLENEFIRIAEEANRSCVRVNVVHAYTTRETMAGKVIEKRREKSSHLSGILMDKGGHVVTLGDALMNASRVFISIYNGKSLENFKADIVGYNLESNLGLIRICKPDLLDPLPMGDSDKVKTGAIVMGLGYTYNLASSPSFSAGMVSAVDRSFRFAGQSQAINSLLQTSLAIHPGETGGPVIDSSSRIIGLLLTSYSPVLTEDRSGQYFFNRGRSACTIVLPVNRVLDEMHSILAREGKDGSDDTDPNEKPWLGLTADEIRNQSFRKKLDLPSGGVLVTGIYPNEPAALAGIMVRDVLKKWEETPIMGVGHLRDLLTSYKVGDRVEIIVIRDGKSVNIKVELGKY